MNRKAAAWCSAFLIVVQMMVGPVAHPVATPLASDDCGRAHHAGAGHPDAACPDCPSTSDHDSSSPPHDPPAKHSGCKCACPCGHTPALAMPSLAMMQPAPPEDLASEPKGPSFAPPLYELLRPPN